MAVALQLALSGCAGPRGAEDSSASSGLITPDAEGRLEHERAWVGHGELEVDCPAGNLQILGAADERLKIRAELGTAHRGIELTHEGRYIQVRTPRERERFEELAASSPDGGGAPASPDLSITVPAGTDVIVHTHSGRTRVSAITGRLDISSVQGSISVEGSPRSVEADSVSGDIRLDVSTPSAVARSVSGELSISGSVADLRAETVDAALKVEAQVGVESLLRTVTGELEFAGNLEPTARLRVESSSGPVMLRLPPELETAFSFESISGDVEGDWLPAKALVETRRAATSGRNLLTARLGSAPRRIEIETFSSSATVFRLGGEGAREGAEEGAEEGASENSRGDGGNQP